MRRVLVLIIALLCGSFSPQLSRVVARALPQIAGVPSSHAGHATDSAILTLAVDGAITPEGISDERAYHHFLKAMAGIKDPAGREAALRRIGLSPADRAVFANAVLPAAAQLAAIAQERRLNPRRVELRQQEQMALTDAHARVMSVLSIEGQELLVAYIRTHVKRHIRIFRGPMPASVQEPV